MTLLIVVVHLLLYSVVTSVSAESMYPDSNYKIIIDNDGGADDAMAVFLALLYEKHFNGPEVLALTTTHGNVIEDQCDINNQKFLKIANRQEIPIYKGSNSSLVHPTTPTGSYYGLDGLGDSNETFTGLIPAQNEFAVTTLLKLSKKYEGELVVIAIGPISNIALAIKMDTDFLKRLKQLYIAGGHVHSEIHETPEFNADTDVEAYKIVMDHATSDLVTILPYSQTEMFLDIEKEWREEVFGSIDTEIVKALNIFERIGLQQSDTWYALDPAMVAAVLNQTLVNEIRYSKLNIETCGEDRGLTPSEFVEDPAEANVRMFYSMDKEAYKSEDRGLTPSEFVEDPAEANVRMFYSMDKEAYKSFLLEVFSKSSQNSIINKSLLIIILTLLYSYIS